MRRVLTFLIFGAIGGFLIWAISEPVNWLTPGAPPGEKEPAISYGAQIVFGALIGMVMGFFIGIAHAKSGMSLRDGVRTVMVAVAVGAIGGIFGFNLASLVYGTAYALVTRSTDTPGIGGFLMLIVARSIGWALIGSFTGVAIGIGSGSSKKITNGGIGGLIGGGLVGAAFEVLVWLAGANISPIGGPMLRLISFTGLGTSIGLFIGLVEELTKSAWIKLMRGRNEGKDFILYKPLTILGRDELADIPVFGDTSVAPQHASVEQDGRRYMLRDLGSTFGTSVNGNRVSEHLLKDGDVIELGSMKLAFYEKATATSVSRHKSQVAASPVAIPQNTNVCQYCGGVKDAQGNCQCSVGGGAPQQAPAAPQTQVFSQGAPAQDPFGPRVPEQFPPDPFVNPMAYSAGASPQGAKLTGMNGAYAGKSFPLKSGDNMIGRESGKDVSLSLDYTVSRNHAKITDTNGPYTIVDEGSANGTFVNGSKITSLALRSGDVIQIGSTTFKFEV